MLASSALGKKKDVRSHMKEETGKKQAQSQIDGEGSGSWTGAQQFHDSHENNFDATSTTHHTLPPLTDAAYASYDHQFKTRLPGYAASMPPALDMANTSNSSDTRTAPLAIASKTATTTALNSSSYPPSSPFLPPGTRGADEPFVVNEATIDHDFRGVSLFDAVMAAQTGGHRLGHSADDHGRDGASGYDWSRHTKVYGGGMCLACLATGGESGGFHGPQVPPEHKYRL